MHFQNKGGCFTGPFLDTTLSVILTNHKLHTNNKNKICYKTISKNYMYINDFKQKVFNLIHKKCMIRKKEIPYD